MKKIKYLHSIKRNKNQKAKRIQSAEKNKSEYFESLKNQAIRTLYDVEKEFLNRAPLNITYHQSQRTVRHYHSRSERQELLRKTFASIQTSSNVKKIKKQRSFDNSYVNIKQLLRIKTQAEIKQTQKLKNPFYKIQKYRNIDKKTSWSQSDSQTKDPQINKSLRKYFQRAQNTRTLDDKVFISRHQKQQYFASKKYQLRTLQYDQTLSAVQIPLKICQNQKQNEEEQALKKQKQISSKVQTKKHSKTSSSISQSSNENIISFKRSESILTPLQDKIIIQQSREQSPVKIRQRTLTVKYNEIKEYFEKKYAKNSHDLQGHSGKHLQN